MPHGNVGRCTGDSQDVLVRCTHTCKTSTQMHTFHTHSHALFSVPSVLKAHTYRMHKIIKYSSFLHHKKHSPTQSPSLTHTHTCLHIHKGLYLRAPSSLAHARHTHHTLRVNKIIKHSVHHMNSCSSVFMLNHQDQPESWYSLLSRCFLHQQRI